MSSVERRRLLCAILFHFVAAICVVWSLFVLIDRAAEEVQKGLIGKSNCSVHSQFNVKFYWLEDLHCFIATIKPCGTTVKILFGNKHQLIKFDLEVMLARKKAKDFIM